MNPELLIKHLLVGQMQTNCYLVIDQHAKEAVIIDPGDDGGYISNTLSDLGVTPTQIIATHGHFDHILATRELQLAFQIPFKVHAADEFLVNRMQQSAAFFLKIQITDPPPRINSCIKAGAVISVGDYKLQIFETPGHTPGSICLYTSDAGILFSGDTLFAHGGVGRTDFEYSSLQNLQTSLRRILSYPAETVIYSGHGSSSTIAAERPFHEG